MEIPVAGILSGTLPMSSAKVAPTIAGEQQAVQNSFRKPLTGIGGMERFPSHFRGISAGI
jgi:hypothetical protein